MTFRSCVAAAIGVAGLVGGGCSVIPFRDDEPRPAARPAPLVAAPAGSVVAQPLPPPASVSAAPAPAPATPPAAATPTPPAPAQVAEATPAGGASGPEIGRTDLLGGWKI